MAFESVSKFQANPNAGGRRPTYPMDEVTFAIDKGTSKGVSCYALRIAVPKEIAKKARFIEGDTVDILFDKEERAGLIKRIIGKGWTLSKWKTSARLTVKLRWNNGMPSVASCVSCPCEITPDGIVFFLPECVSFDHNLREEAGKK